MNEGFDAIVVGVGAMGASACYALASRGAKVLGLEQFDIPHNLGSSHGHSRIIRKAYFEHPDYVPLLKAAYAGWGKLEARAQTFLLGLIGGLWMGPPDGMVVAGSVRAAREHGLRHEVLTYAQIRERYPQFRIPEDWIGCFEPEAGFLEPEKCISAFVQTACEDGATIRAREAVREWHADANGVRVRTDRGEYHADQLIFTGGAWTSKLVRDLGVELHVTRQVLGWVWPKNPRQFSGDRFPCWGIDSLDGGMYYGFPMMTSVPGLKVAHHLPGTRTDPDTINREPNREDELDFRPLFAKHLPDGDGPLLAMKICMYTNSPDGHFIVDRHPEFERVQLACGFSGHGFKFASVIGEILADRALDGETTLPADFLRLKRFRI